MNRQIRTLLVLKVLGAMAGVAFAATPITFEENRGQASREAAFVSRGAGYRVLLTADAAVIAGRDGGTVRIGLFGAKPASPVGLQRVAAKSNYLIGSDPAKWHTGIANYEEVRYAHAYPGIDLVWHGRAGQIEQDFRLAPGADARRIRLAIRGARPEVTPEHDLVAGNIRLHKPRAYQDGREIACRYQLRGRSVGFALGEYDRTRPLTIDPVLSFSTFLGGDQADSAESVKVDGAGNIYVAGTTASANFPISAGAFQQTFVGGACGESGNPSPCPDVFVTKFTGDGSTLLFSTFLGGSGYNALTGMAIDKSGNVYLTGFAPSNFPKLTLLPGYPAQSSGFYVAKLSADGSSLLYSSMLPIPPEDSVSGLAVDAAGAVYLTGSTSGGLPIVNALQNANSQPPVFKTTDSAVHWQGLMNGLPSDLVDSITVDPNNPQTVYLGMWQGLYKSADGGAHWTALLTAIPPPALYPGEILDPAWLAVDPSHSQTLYLGLSNGIYKSTDGGATWSPAGAGASGYVVMIAINPASTTTLYAASGAGLYKSTDGAATWNHTGLMAGPNDTSFVHDVVIDPLTPTTIYAGTPNGVMKSLDGGVTWTAMTNGFTQSTDIDALVIDPVNPQTLYTATTINFAPYRTTDGGAHWTQGQWPSRGGLLPYVLWLLVDPLVHSTIWAVTDEGLLVSRDAGATWTAPPTDLPDYDVQKLASGSDGAIYAIANNFSADAFAMKLDPSGSKIVYSTYLGGSGPDWGYGIAVDSAGRAYVTGFTASFDFPVANALQPHPAGMKDGFVSVLDATGSQLVWSTYFGGSDDDWPSAIALDPAGNVHLTGWTFSMDFPLRLASQTRLAGTSAFATKLKGDGSGLIFSTYLGGSGGDTASAVAADAAGNTYIAGSTRSQDFPAVNAVQSALAGIQNGFVAAWNGQTGALQYATYLGGSGSDAANAIAADAAGNAYIAGWTNSPDFPRKYAFQYTNGACTSYAYGCQNQDAFLAKIAPQAAGPAIALAGVTNAASYGTVVSPGEIVSVFGTALAVTPASAGAPPLPVKLSDVSVSVNGVAAPLLYVSPVQINAQIPFETAAGTAQIQVSSSAGTATLKVQVAPAAPAIFTLNSEGSGAGAIEQGLTGQLVTNSNPAAAGEIISVYCTGLGAVNPPAVTGAAAPVPPPQTVLQVQAYIAGVPAQVTYAGLAPGFAGLYQINVQVPANTPSGVQDLQVWEAGASSNAVTVAIR